MYSRLDEAMASTNWKDAHSVKQFADWQAAEMVRVSEMVLHMDPAVIENFGQSLTAGLIGPAAQTVLMVAYQRQQEEFRKQDEAKRLECQQILREEFDWVQRNMLRLCIDEMLTKQARAELNDSRFLKLQVLAAWAQTMSSQQALLFANAYFDSPTVPMRDKANRMGEMLIDRAGDAYYRTWRKKTLENGGNEAIQTMDALRETLSKGSIKDMIRESTSPQTGKAGVRDVERQILEAIQQHPGLTDEQRARCQEAASAAFRQYVMDNGLQSGLPTDPSALGMHAAGIRGCVTNGLTDVLMHHPELDPKAFCDLVHSIEQTCDAAAGADTLDSRHVKAAFEAERAMLAEAGLDVSGMDYDASLAEMARAMLNDAKAVFDDPASASKADMEMVNLMAAVADKAFDPIEQQRFSPENPAMSRADLDRYMAKVMEQGPEALYTQVVQNVENYMNPVGAPARGALRTIAPDDEPSLANQLPAPKPPGT